MIVNIKLPAIATVLALTCGLQIVSATSSSADTRPASTHVAMNAASQVTWKYDGNAGTSGNADLDKAIVQAVKIWNDKLALGRDFLVLGTQAWPDDPNTGAKNPDNAAIVFKVASKGDFSADAVTWRDSQGYFNKQTKTVKWMTPIYFNPAILDDPKRTLTAALHEIGHALGLAHPSDLWAVGNCPEIMSYACGYNTTINSAERDLVKSIYGLGSNQQFNLPAPPSVLSR